MEDALVEWFGPGWLYIKGITVAPLLWMMRAYVKTKLGNEVENIEHLPEHLSAAIVNPTLIPTEEAFHPTGGTRLWPSWLLREPGRHSNTGYQP